MGPASTSVLGGTRVVGFICSSQGSTPISLPSESVGASPRVAGVSSVSIRPAVAGRIWVLHAAGCTFASALAPLDAACCSAAGDV